MAARTAAVLAFIAIVAIVAFYLAQRTTIMRGEVMASDMLAEVRAKGITTVSTIVCDDEIPIGANGARFTCWFRGVDGSTETWEYTMHRDGTMAGRQLAAARPTQHRMPSSGDPWE